MSETDIVAACRATLVGAECFGADVIDEVLSTMPYTGDVTTDIQTALAAARLANARVEQFAMGRLPKH